MNNSSRSVTVKLLGKEYTISCPDGAEAELLASADFLNQKMKEIHNSGKVVGLERIAIMAALNTSHELIKSKEEQRQIVEGHLRRISGKIDQSLARIDAARDEE